MKKTISLIMAILMLGSMLALFAVPAMAEGDEKPTFKMYVADSGNDSNNGTSPETPKKTINAIIDYALTYLPHTEDDGTRLEILEIVLVGDVSASVTTSVGSSGIFSNHEAKGIPVIITSSDKAEHVFKLDKGIRLGGETMFTNIIIATTSNTAPVPVIYAAGHKLTMGKEGVANDVITYSSAAGSVEALSIVGTTSELPRSNQNSTYYLIPHVDITINSGTYKDIALGGWDFGGWVEGDINCVINDATFSTDGTISIGGIYGRTNKYAGIFMCEGDVNVVINGGDFTKAKICVGYATNQITNNGDTFFSGHEKQITLNSGDYAKNYFLGDVKIDINGGAFDGTNVIGKGSTFAASTYPDMAAHLSFEKYIEVDISDIKLEDRAPYMALVCEDDKGTEAGQINVTEHKYESYAKYDEFEHKAICNCSADCYKLEPHTWDDGVMTTKNTHASDGVMTYTCTKCSETREEVIPAGHCMEYVQTADAHYKACSAPDCPDANKNAQTSEVHAFGEVTITKAPTHTEDGSQESTCDVCGYKKVEVIEKDSNAHTLSEEWIKHDENQHKKTCECGFEKYQDHTWGSPIPEGNEKVYTCTVCGEKKRETVEVSIPEEKKGCFSSISVGIFAVAVTGAAFALITKKKED